MIAGVLLITDPAKLEGGPCGYRPPMACRCPWCEKWVEIADHCACACDLCNVDPPRALALAWAGEVIDVGVIVACPGDALGLCGWVLALLKGGMCNVDRAVFDDVFGDLGTWVLIDEHGREVQR